MSQDQATPKDHLAAAREYIVIAESTDSKREAYMKAADEIIAAQKDDPELGQAKIGRTIGKSATWVAQLVQWRTSAHPDATPFSGPELRAQRDRYSAKTVLRDPGQRRQALAGLDDDELAAIRDDAAQTRLERLRAEAREHAPGEPERKARLADLDENLRRPTMSALGRLVSPDAYIESAVNTMKQIETESLQLANYDECVDLLLDLNDRMWRYGAVHGFDVSKLAEAAARLRGES